MQFKYEPALEKYMRQKGKKTIIVEVISSNSSDFEVTELHVHFANDRQTAFFKNTKHFRAIKTDMGEVLLPPYRLEYADTITFGIKSFLGIRYVAQEGIRL